MNRIILFFFGQVIKYCSESMNNPQTRKALAAAFAKKYDLPLLSEEQEEAIAELVLGVVSEFLAVKGVKNGAA